MNLQDFIEGQEKIYSAIKEQGEEALEVGHFAPNQKVLAGEGGYLVGLQYRETINNVFSELSRLINEVIPSLTYDSKNLHTTLFVIDKKQDFKPEQTRLGVLNNVISEVMKSKAGEIVIDFEKYLFNQDSVLAAGTPNFDFIDLCNTLIHAFTEKELNVTYPKMAHITLARFIEEGTKSSVLEVDRLVSTHSVPERVKPLKIILGYFDTDREGFKLSVQNEWVL